MDIYQIKRLEKEMEDLRDMLYQSVDGIPSRLTVSNVLPLSKLLDDVIIKVQKSKQSFYQ